MYFDYTATTPINPKVLESFIASCQYYANPNSHHQLGKEAKQEIDEAIISIKELLKIQNEELIFTSGSSEANNLAILGLAQQYPKKKHIITTRFEHSSVIAPINYLQKHGYDIDFVETNEHGEVIVDELINLISEDTLLVSIIAVNSEIGIRQPITQISQALKNKNVFLHVDATQAIGKIPFDFKDIDLVSFTAHKIYGIKGIGCLVKNPKLKLSPIILGGSSTTKYRSGTPTTQLIVSFAKAIQLAYQDLMQNYQYVSKLNKALHDALWQQPNILINSQPTCSPYIFNLSILNMEADEIQKLLSNNGIYVSTKSACSSNTAKSLQILNLYHDELRAKTAIRISLSYLTTDEELEVLIATIIKIAKGELQ